MIKFSIKVNKLISMAALIAAGSAIADDADLLCTGGEIPSYVGDVHVIGTCSLPPANVVDGDINVLPGGVLLPLRGIVNGTVKGESIESTQSITMQIGEVYGDIIETGKGSIRMNGGLVDGNIKQQGTGFLLVDGYAGAAGAATVTGNIDNRSGANLTIRVFAGSSVYIGGNVMNRGGGVGRFRVFDGSITIEGKVCGVPAANIDPGVEILGKYSETCPSDDS